MDKPTINILYFEDNPADVILIREMLAYVRNIKYKVRHVDRLSFGLQELAETPPDIILLDLNLPDSKDLGTFTTVKNAAGNIPIIIMSGLADEDLAVRAVQQGAQDYLIKGGMEADLLLRALRYGIERQKLVVELQQALEQIKTLKGLLPICACCKNIRDDKGYWHQIEDYVRSHSDAEFSHGICPECISKYYPDFKCSGVSKKDESR